MTACGGMIFGCEIRRNEQCPLCGLAAIEPAGQQRYIDWKKRRQGKKEAQ